MNTQTPKEYSEWLIDLQSEGQSIYAWAIADYIKSYANKKVLDELKSLKEDVDGEDGDMYSTMYAIAMSKVFQKRIENIEDGVPERIEYIEHELASKRHDGYTEKGLKEELKKLKDN